MLYRGRCLCVVLMMVISSSVWAELQDNLPCKRGDFAFAFIGDGVSYMPEELSWLKRFNIVSTWACIPKEQVKEFHAAGCKLVCYDWTTGFYAPKERTPDSWECKLVEEHPDYVLNASKPLVGVTNPLDPRESFYYDYASPEGRAWRVKYLVDLARKHDYDGFFFDCTTILWLPEELREVFKKRHPNADYDVECGKFFKELRETAPNLILFANQAYHRAACYYNYVDYDLTESLFVNRVDPPKAEIYVEGKGKQLVSETRFSYWRKGMWPVMPGREHIRQQMRTAGVSMRIRHLTYGYPRYEPTGETTHVDANAGRVYKETLDREAIYYTLAGSYLMGDEGYYWAQHCVGADDIYFFDIGKPVSDYTEDTQRKVYWRVFRNGVAVVNESLSDASFTFPREKIPSDLKGLWDLFENKQVCDFTRTLTVTIPPAEYPATNRRTPSGRIYAFLR